MLRCNKISSLGDKNNNGNLFRPPCDARHAHKRRALVVLQVSSTNIGAVITVSFNVASVEANPGDWGWVMGGVDPSFDVADANALESGRAFNQFVEGCWFYFGQAVSLGHPFLCTRDPDQELASLQASTTETFYQYGSFQLYSATAGNVSLWYAVDEAYDFFMIYNYYTCGIHVQAPASTVVRVAAAGVVVFPAAFRLLTHDALLSNCPSITITTTVSMFTVRYFYV